MWCFPEHFFYLIPNIISIIIVQMIVYNHIFVFILVNNILSTVLCLRAAIKQKSLCFSFKT